MMSTSTRDARWFRRWLQSAAVAAVCLVAPGSGQALSYFDLTVGGDFDPHGIGGTPDSDTATDGDVSLTLYTLSMTPENEVDLTNGSPGVLYVNELGMGVRPSLDEGSTEISGGGRHNDEVLIFEFSAPVVTSSVNLLLTHKSSMKSRKQDDRAEVYIDDIRVLTEDEVLELLEPVAGEDGTFLLPLAGLLPEELDQLAVRAVSGHILVSGIELTTVPEPSALALQASVLVALVGLARHRQP